MHFAENPLRAIKEAARLLRPNGILAIADFAPHNIDSLRTDYAHRQLGFPADEVQRMFEQAGLEYVELRVLKGHPLTVNIWTAIPSIENMTKGVAV